MDQHAPAARERLTLSRPRTAGGWRTRGLWLAVAAPALIGSAVAIRRTVRTVSALVAGPAAGPVAGLAAGAPGGGTQRMLASLDAVFTAHAALTLLHVVPGLVFLVLAPWQFSRALRARHPRRHRVVGWGVVGAGAVVGVTALAMTVAMPAIGGASQAAATGVFGLVFLVALAKAVLAIRRRDVAAHRAWMLRAFAVGLAIGTVRPIAGLFFATRRLHGLTPREFFGAAFWLGFVLHLVAAEVWIAATRRGPRPRPGLDPAAPHVADPYGPARAGGAATG